MERLALRMYGGFWNYRSFNTGVFTDQDLAIIWDVLPITTSPGDTVQVTGSIAFIKTATHRLPDNPAQTAELSDLAVKAAFNACVCA